MKGVHSFCDFHRVQKHLLSNKGVVFAVKKRPFLKFFFAHNLKDIVSR